MEEGRLQRLVFIVVLLTFGISIINYTGLSEDPITGEKNPNLNILETVFFSLFEAIVLVGLYAFGKEFLKKYISETSSNYSTESIAGFFAGELEQIEIYGVGLVQPKTRRQSVGIGAGKGGVGLGTSVSYYSGDEQLKVDSGTIFFDHKKIQFIGGTKQMAWEWSKIINVSIGHGILDSTIYIAVSSRKNISGIMLRSDKGDVEDLANRILNKANID